MQSKFLQEKADALQDASGILKRITDSCCHHKFISWENVIQLIDVYQISSLAIFP